MITKHHKADNKKHNSHVIIVHVLDDLTSREYVRRYHRVFHRSSVRVQYVYVQYVYVQYVYA